MLETLFYLAVMTVSFVAGFFLGTNERKQCKDPIQKFNELYPEQKHAGRPRGSKSKKPYMTQKQRKAAYMRKWWKKNKERVKQRKIAKALAEINKKPTLN